MKKIIFTGLLCTIVILSAEAQLKFISAAHPNKKENTSVKKVTKDPHWKYSDYEPKTTKKEAKTQKRETRKLQANSYSPEKASYYDRKEAREAKAQHIRQSRIKDGTYHKKDKKIKSVRKDHDKKYAQKEQVRDKKVRDNKKNYGTRKSRKKSLTDKSVFAPKAHLIN
jgi:hypothetical protein